jgi:hypothetical protein
LLTPGVISGGGVFWDFPRGTMIFAHADMANTLAGYLYFVQGGRGAGRCCKWRCWTRRVAPISRWSMSFRWSPFSAKSGLASAGSALIF